MKNKAPTSSKSLSSGSSLASSMISTVLKVILVLFTSSCLSPSGERFMLSSVHNMHLMHHVPVIHIARFSQHISLALHFPGHLLFHTGFSCQNCFYLKIVRFVLILEYRVGYSYSPQCRAGLHSINCCYPCSSSCIRS